MLISSSQPNSSEELAVPQVILSVVQVLLLSCVSIFLVVYAATNEPFVEFHRFDVILMVGGGATTLAFWGWFVVTQFANFLRGNVRLIIVLTSTTWALICIFYLVRGPLSYPNDIIRFAIPN